MTIARWASEIGSSQNDVLFSVEYAYERTPSAAPWFGEAQFSNELKPKVYRENANELLALRSPVISASGAAVSGS